MLFPPPPGIIIIEKDSEVLQSVILPIWLGSPLQPVNIKTMVKLIIAIEKGF